VSVGREGCANKYKGVNMNKEIIEIKKKIKINNLVLEALLLLMKEKEEELKRLKNER
tara:strand:+ start:25 stop:195 length:171 start_codon:yes stop_codon:yes gene_type:complete